MTGQTLSGGVVGAIADDLIRTFRARRMFGAGCADGFLVEALWDRGRSLSEQNRVLAELNAVLNLTRTETQAILRSTFWRLTEPFRSIASRLPPSLRRRIRELGKSIYWGVQHGRSCASPISATLIGMNRGRKYSIRVFGSRFSRRPITLSRATSENFFRHSKTSSTATGNGCLSTTVLTSHLR